MFNIFRSKLNKLIENIRLRELSEDELEKYRDDFVLFLVENEVSYDVADKIYSDFIIFALKNRVERLKNPKSLIKNLLKDFIYNVFKSVESRELYDIIRGSASKPYKIVFMGVNGVGKTTTIAKVAYYLKNKGLRPLLVCSDTFRAGAIEQLRIHAERLNLPFFTVDYGHDPAAVAYDAILHAGSRGLDVVLIDTAGRQYSNTNLMDELRKIVRVNVPDMNILVLDSLTGSDAYTQAKEFSSVGYSHLIFTKVDADVKGGAILTVTFDFRKPILFLGNGQKYSDLIRFNSSEIINLMFEGV